MENKQNNISLGFEVDDIYATKSFLESNRVKILSGPSVLSHGVKLLHAKNPNGISLGFVEHSRDQH